MCVRVCVHMHLCNVFFLSSLLQGGPGAAGPVGPTGHPGPRGAVGMQGDKGADGNDVSLQLCQS